MHANYDWHQFAKSNLQLYLSEDVLQRLLILGYNCRSLDGECCNQAYGKIDYRKGIAYVGKLSEMCLTSDPGACSFDAASHSCSAMDDYRVHKQFDAFWDEASSGDCFMDIHTHMCGQFLRNGVRYEEFWKFSGADISSYLNISKVFTEKNVLFFGSIVYIDDYGDCGLAIVHYDFARRGFCHVDKVFVVDSDNLASRQLQFTRYGHLHIGNILTPITSRSA